MLPKNAYEIIGGEFLNEKQPDKTYRLTEESLGGFIYGREAVTQAAFKILNTERYRYPIYGSDYGAEFEDLFGKDPDFVIAELERRITEALTADERIKNVRDYEFKTERGKIFVTFVMETVYGDIEITGKETGYV